MLIPAQINEPVGGRCEFARWVCKLRSSGAAIELPATLIILSRIEFETPQIVYLLRCRVCDTTHSVEFSALEGEPGVLAQRYQAAA